MIFLRDADGTYGYGNRARTSPTGLFTLSDVFDGRYRLTIAGQSKDSYLKAVRYGATEALEDGAWEDPDFLKTFEKQGQTVSLEEADSKTVDVVAIKTKGPD